MLSYIVIVKIRITTGECLALLYLTSTTLTIGHNTSKAICPEKDNQDGDHGICVDGI